MIHFWEESFWLPSNTSWKDFENRPDKPVVYGTVQDLWVQIPMVPMILVLRHFCEKNLFRPLGKYLNISAGNNRKAPENYVLEAHYRQSAKLKDLSQIAKKVDMSERQVERWWRLRHSQDKPSTLVKFTENMWKGSFYLCKESYAITVLCSKDWAWNIELCFEGYPHQGITNDVKWYYIISSAFYWSLTIAQFYDFRRKDFWQMFIHHFATIILITFSWICNIHRVGSLVLFLHDISNIFLEFAKAAIYARASTRAYFAAFATPTKLSSLVNILFWGFVFTWTFTRLFIFPVFVLYRNIEAIVLRSLQFRFPMFILLNVLLCFLLVLSLFWTWLIAKVLFKVLFCGKEADDVRSSCSDPAATDDGTCKEHNNNKLKTK